MNEQESHLSEVVTLLRELRDRAATREDIERVISMMSGASLPPTGAGSSGAQPEPSLEIALRDVAAMSEKLRSYTDLIKRYDTDDGDVKRTSVFFRGRHLLS